LYPFRPNKKGVSVNRYTLFFVRGLVIKKGVIFTVVRGLVSNDSLMVV
jgi:hypothetical protein